MTAVTRNALQSDVLTIYGLVKELAHYEKSADQVKATLQDYEKAFSEGVFQALVAEHDDRIVGTAIYYMTWSTWRGKMLYLEDFVVQQSVRRLGFGQKLFDAYINKAHQLNCAMVKWQVLDWNEPAIKFYEKNNATIEKQWWNGKIIF